MFTRVYSLLSDDLWKSDQRTTNPVESMSSLDALLENSYADDRAYATKLAASAKKCDSNTDLYVDFAINMNIAITKD